MKSTCRLYRQKKRIPYLDILRAIAIVSITFNHAVNRSFAIYGGQYAEFQTIPFFLTSIKAVLYAFSRIGVPLFLMISGALLLPRDYSGGLQEGSVSRFMKHNWLRLFITTEIWLAIMFWYKQLMPGSILRMGGPIRAIIHFIMTLLFLNPDTMGSMWYMEMILCVYLLIPLLAIAVKKIHYSFFLIPMAIVVFCSYILPDLNGAFAAVGANVLLETKLESANVFSMYVVYLLLGYYISKGALSKIKTSVLWIMLAAAFLGFCAFQTWFFSIEYDFVVAADYRSFFPMIVAIILFEIVRRYKDGKCVFIEKISTKLSTIAFGIYFVHICIMEGLCFVINRYGIDIMYLWKFVLLESVSFFGSIPIILLCSKSKRMREYLFNIK